MGFNSLSGTIPRELSNTDLRLLDLRSNMLSGTVPVDFQTLEGLSKYIHTYCILCRNSASDEAGSDYRPLAKSRLLTQYLRSRWSQICLHIIIDSVYLQENNLVGTMDFAFCSPRRAQDLEADCRGGDIAQITCSCCSFCCSDDQPCDYEV